jgi:hypothetical protein
MICKVFRRFLIVLCLAVSCPWAFAQEPPSNSNDTSHESYRSAADDLLTIDKVTVLPFTDNLQGIYSRPLEAHFIQLVDQAHRWNFVAANTSGPILSPEELEESPEKALQVSQGMGVDAFFAAQITKGPNGITIHLSLFLSKDGKLLAQAVLKDYKQFSLNDLKEQMQRLLSEIVARLPYSGRILSRDGQRVTINLGTRDGIQMGQLLTVIQIIQLQRHPKFNFLVHSEKEIFGRIKVQKVDETLSFASIINERERGAIQKNAKIGPLDFVSYSDGDNALGAKNPADALAGRDDSNLAFGKDPKAWQPSKPPTFGQIGGRIGVSQVSENMQLNGGAGSLSAKDNFSPSISLEGEIWITPEWTFHAHLSQGLLQISNPRSGSSPSQLNQEMSDYEAAVGYVFRFGPHIWSAHLEPYLGYFTYQLYSDSSQPLAFTTMNYSGFKIGVRGESPIDSASQYGVGGQFAMAIRPGLHETPVSSGDSSSNNVTEFGIYGYKKLSEHIKLTLQLDFNMYSSNFSGAGDRVESASSASQRYTTLSVGMYYLF